MDLERRGLSSWEREVGCDQGPGEECEGVQGVEKGDGDAEDNAGAAAEYPGQEQDREVHEI